MSSKATSRHKSFGVQVFVNASFNYRHRQRKNIVMLTETSTMKTQEMHGYESEIWDFKMLKWTIMLQQYQTKKYANIWSLLTSKNVLFQSRDVTVMTTLPVAGSRSISQTIVQHRALPLSQSCTNYTRLSTDSRFFYTNYTDRDPGTHVRP